MHRGAPPLPVRLVAALAVAFASIPLVALVVRTPWSGAADLFEDDAVRDAMVRSLGLATVAAALALVLGVAVARSLTGRRGPLATTVRAAVTLPVVLPPVAAGVALLEALGRSGLLGGSLDAVGVRLPFTEAAVVVAQTYVALPFVVLVCEAAFDALERDQVETAATLGAGRWRTLWEVELPGIRSALGAAAALGWARALGELGATLTFAGIVPGITETMPLRILVELESRPEAATLLAVTLLGVAAVVLVGLRRSWLTRPAAPSAQLSDPQGTTV